MESVCLNHNICPICLNILNKPITYPCGHGLCKKCLETSFIVCALTVCPICRKSHNSWLRKSTLNNTLIDKKRERFIKKHMKLIKEQNRAKDKKITKPGEIHKEYLMAVEKYEMERTLAVAQEEAQSSALISKILKNDQKYSRKRPLSNELKGLRSTLNVQETGQFPGSTGCSANDIYFRHNIKDSPEATKISDGLNGTSDEPYKNLRARTFKSDLRDAKNPRRAGRC